jgi:superfamily II DNA/RNA helicase
MNVTKSSLDHVDAHWAVQAIGSSRQKRGLELSNQLLVDKALGQQIHFNFEYSSSDEELLSKLAMAYEMAAIEGLNDFINPASDDNKMREQCAAGAHRAFEIRRLFNLPDKDEEKVLHILHLSSLAYCGDRWSDLRRWYNENDNIFDVPSVSDSDWNHRLLYRIFDCWIRLFRKKGWDDLDRIREIVAGLREDQKTYESSVLKNASVAEDRANALRLIALYHWAKGTELLAKYMLQGDPVGIITLLDKHFESAIDAATAGADAQLEVLMRWLHATSRQMVAGSVWRVARAVNSRVTKFVREVTRQQALFELLPPQRAAIQEQGLLDQAATAVVVDMPTSGGKTLLAQFRILQALNQFDNDESGKGWVAYVAPTKALTSQISRRLRRDFEPIGVNVEQLTGAVEIDAFEEDLLVKSNEDNAFDVLVATPEKLQLIIRNKKINRPLALVVMDEAHNIEDEHRGMRIELLLATIKGECESANFLLLMPFVEKPEILARWLAQDVSAGRAISFGTTPWKPNERIVGLFEAEADDSVNAGWRMKYQTLITTPNTIHLNGKHNVGEVKPLNIPKSTVLASGRQTSMPSQAAAMAKTLSGRGTSIAVANNTNHVWSMARKIYETLEPLPDISEEIKLVQNFLRTEVSRDFELVKMLGHGVGVHHAGLSDEVRTLIEWLAEEGQLKVLCATTTIAQGINFPVSSVFLASNKYQSSKYPYTEEMKPREFWNLAGRAGRMNHDSVGVVGIAAGNNPKDIMKYVSRTTGELASCLVKLLNDLEKQGQLNNLEAVIHREQWEDFRCYVAHLWNEKKNLDAVLADTEQLLRNTFGYGLLKSKKSDCRKADKLLEATRNYARELEKHPERAALADMTGFSPEGIAKAFAGINNLERKLTIDDWKPNSLFGGKSGMADMYGVMLKIPQLKNNLEEIAGRGSGNKQIADITQAWVNGKSIEDIARDYFNGGENQTMAITAACKAIYKTLVNNGTWGISALSRLSGIDFESLSEKDKRQINIIPAMIYHGVRTEEGVLMRMNSIPRSIAESVGKELKRLKGQENSTINEARAFIKEMDQSTWDRLRPTSSSLSGTDYKKVWGILSGEGR